MLQDFIAKHKKRQEQKRIQVPARGMNTEPLAERTLRMDVGAWYIPKKSSKSPRGEDAHFICRYHQTIGIADGVGGWARKGIDGGLYARQLMGNCLIALYRQGADGARNPKKVLEEAYSDTYAKGSSTACIITLENNYLKTVNIGDSGFMLFRNGHMIYKSPTQQHYFNCPFQLGKSTPCDNPSMAEEVMIEVKAGDVVVAGTDGLFDNMFESEMEELVELSHGGALNPRELAWLLAEYATVKSMDEQADSPFSRAAAAEGQVESGGGKPDDVTVVVARILSPNNPFEFQQQYKSLLQQNTRAVTKYLLLAYATSSTFALFCLFSWLWFKNSSFTA